jgi:hypothetical protein
MNARVKTVLDTKTMKTNSVRHQMRGDTKAKITSRRKKATRKSKQSFNCGQLLY